jgi:hypothetical protein
MMSLSGFELIADKNCSEAQLISAISNLGPVRESAQFWIEIAENSSYSILHRRHCIFQLFYRHVTQGLTLASLATLLNIPSWLTENNITVVEDIGGSIPVKLSFENSVVVLNILPGKSADLNRWQIYISVNYKTDSKFFFKLISGAPTNQDTENLRIIEIGFSPPALDSLGAL